MNDLMDKLKHLSPEAKRWGAYYLKAAALFAAFFLFVTFARSMPAPLVGIIWAATSAAAAIWPAYSYTMRKVGKQVMYKDTGRIGKFNNGRIVVFFVLFVISAFCVASTMLDVPRWGVLEWVLALAVALLFPVVFRAASTFVHREYEPLFQAVSATRIACVASALLMLALFAAVLALEPGIPYSSEIDAFLRSYQPFEGAASALLEEGGIMTGVVNGLTAYGLTVMAEISGAGFFIVRVVLSASIAFGIASLLGACSLPLHEARRILLPLHAENNPADPANGPRPRFIAAVALPPLVLAAAFCIADPFVAQAAQSDEGTAANKFACSLIGVAAVQVDGTFYDHQAIQDLKDETEQSTNVLSVDERAALEAAIDAAYDTRLANAESYVSWYSSLAGNSERIGQLLSGSLEVELKEQLEARIADGTDDSELLAMLSAYLDDVALCRTAYQEKLESCKLEGIPDWLITKQDTFDKAYIERPIAWANTVLAAAEALGMQPGVQPSDAFITNQIVAKITAKDSFGHLISVGGKTLAADIDASIEEARAEMLALLPAE